MECPHNSQKQTWVCLRLRLRLRLRVCARVRVCACVRVCVRVWGPGITFM